MKYRALTVSAALSVAALAVFSACSGGSNGSMPAASVQPLAAPTTAPTAAPPALALATFSTATRGAQSGLAATNGFAVYNFDLDLTTPGLSACAAPVPPATPGCTTFLPPVVPPTGVTLVAPFGKITRPEGTIQLTYNGHPLYTYAEDTTAASAMGDGITASGGLWHLGQPSTADLTTPDFAPASTATVAPYSSSRALH
jgi:predicted lipoprotein with Yx(FWY)xxD motif